MTPSKEEPGMTACSTQLIIVWQFVSILYLLGKIKFKSKLTTLFVQFALHTKQLDQYSKSRNLSQNNI